MKFDDAIKKSLYDKSTDSFEYNPNIVVNNNKKCIKHKIIEKLREAKKINIAVSYVVWSGLSLIYKDLKKFDKESRILITTESLVTDPTSLKRLLELNLTVRIYNPYLDSKGFHLKSFSFDNGNFKTLLIGSNNISARAFGLAHEMAVEINSKQDGYIIQTYEDIFEELWNDDSTVDLTMQFISGYEEVYKSSKAMDSSIFESFINPKEIIPNKMQKEALNNLKEARKEFNKGLVIAATGTGKTFLSAFDVKATQSKKILFLVHSRLILSSALLTYKKVFPEKRDKMLHMYPSDIDKFKDYDFIFTTDKTANSLLLNKVPSDYFDYIVYDESHKIGEETIYRELFHYFTPKFSLGMTATPERTDNPKHLFSLFEYSVPYEIRLLDALENELVCPFTYYGFNLEESLLNGNEKFDYIELAKYLKKIIDEKGHYGEKLRAIIFCQNIKEAEELSYELNNIGYLSELAVSGKGISDDDIDKYIKSLKSSKDNSLEIICTVNKFNEGVDIPDINTIVMIRNTTSSIVYLQQLGRGLRRTNDPHKYVTVFDIIGNSSNNYSISQVLTGNKTADKRVLYREVNDNFNTVSPFINVEIEEKAIEKILNSISTSFKVETMIKRKLKEELDRYPQIPRLVSMYNDENFNELELLQLLSKELLSPLEQYYVDKYNIIVNTFTKDFFGLIFQFVFRGYNNRDLKDYVRLLKGELVDNDLLKGILLPGEVNENIKRTNHRSSDYNKTGKNNPKVFKIQNGFIILDDNIIDNLKDHNAHELFLEHIELFEEISKKDDYCMKQFDIVDKAEFLLYYGSKDLFLNAVGEKIFHEEKKVYCPIKIAKETKNYENHIIGNDILVYHTQNSSTEQKAINSINKLIDGKYEFHICVNFPHLGFDNNYINLAELEVMEVSPVIKRENGKFNHTIKFKLSNKFPEELLQYKKSN